MINGEIADLIVNSAELGLAVSDGVLPRLEGSVKESEPVCSVASSY